MNTQKSPYLCHIFICTNVRNDNPENPGCGTKCGPELKALLKKAVNERGWKGKVRVSTSGCMGLCGTGPNVVLYPQGIHFSAVTEDDIPQILNAIEQQLSEKNIWFPVKRYGYGWGFPCCWQGWTVLLTYIALIAAAPLVAPPQKSLPCYLAYLTVLTAALIFICWQKGEKPRWRWGN
jgi:(2Fe-2S) ferredoxin